MTAYWCETALLDGVATPSVRLVVDDGRFVEVDVHDPEPSDRRLPGITVPGLANAHSHAFHRALRSRTHGEGGSFWTWRDEMYRAAGRLDPDSYRALARATFAEMALAGITTVGEFHYLHHQRDGIRYDDANAMGHAVIAAAADAGIRITLLDAAYLHGGLGDDGYAALAGVQRRFGDGTIEAWAERVEDIAPAEHVRIGAAIHSVRAVDPAAAAIVAAWARTNGRPLHAHVSEQPAENARCRAVHGVTPTRLLADAGAIGQTFTAVHATHLDTDDVVALGAATVCLCPTTERDLGDGIGPCRELVGAGARLTLGSDSHAAIDLFEEARAVELDERLRSVERGVVAPEDLLRAATVDGHRSLGWSDVGAFAVGQRADLVTVSTDSVRLAGVRPGHALAAIVFAASAADVTSVVIDGRVVVADGRHTAIDVVHELDTAICDLMEGAA